MVNSISENLKDDGIQIAAFIKNADCFPPPPGLFTIFNIFVTMMAGSHNEQFQPTSPCPLSAKQIFR